MTGIGRKAGLEASCAVVVVFLYLASGVVDLYRNTSIFKYS